MTGVIGGENALSPALPRLRACGGGGARQIGRHRMTLEALADVDAGRVVDHQAVQGKQERRRAGGGRGRRN